MEGQECGTGWLRDDRSSRDADLQLHSIVHGVISMDKSAREYGKARRQVEILKLRGTPYSEGAHDYSIVTGEESSFLRLIPADPWRGGRIDSFPSEFPESELLTGRGAAAAPPLLLLCHPGS